MKESIVCSLILFCFISCLFSVTALDVSAHDDDAGGAISDISITVITFAVPIVISEIAYIISPIDEWKAEINILTEDANFVRRQMFFTDNPFMLQRGELLLKEIEMKKQAKQKKLSRFNRRFYTVIGVVGTGVLVGMSYLLRR